MKSFMTNEDSGAKPNLSLDAPDYVDSVETSGSAVQFTVPAGARYVVFSAADNFAAAYGANPTAALPSGSAVTDGSGSELNPAVRRLDGIAKISVIGSCQITLSYYE